MNIEKIKRLDTGIYQAAKKFNVLKQLTWPAGEGDRFLKNWNKGIVKLPKVVPIDVDCSDKIKELDALQSKCDRENPIEDFLYNTADSYVLGGRMLKSFGTKDFTLYSSKIYGKPDDIYKSQKITVIDAAHFLLDVSKRMMGNILIPKVQFNISPEDFADWMRKEVDCFFTQDNVEVVIDASISSRAIAGSKKIKISPDTLFSELDKKQLLNHEAFIHTATILNGMKQNNLKCLSLGPPRTTRTQEGIAVFSELVTLSMDIVRLRRIALRVIAIKMALDGADFVEVFKYFISEGQSPVNAVSSAQRIFRGGDVRGGIVFTKDFVYLAGLLELHNFLRIAITENRIDLVQNLFAGRLTIGDTIMLADSFENGWLAPPVYMPDWARDFTRLGTMLTYSAFVAQIQLNSLELENFVLMEERLKIR